MSGGERPRHIGIVSRIKAFPRSLNADRESVEAAAAQQAICVKIIYSWRAGDTRLIPSWLGAETHARSVLKAISWRTLGTVDTFVISWFMTGKVQVAGSIAILEVGTKVAWYYLHERIWAAIAWGRRHHH